MEGAINIRPMIVSDVAPLTRLMASSPLWRRYNVTEAGAARRLSDGLANSMTIAVAEIEREPVGFVWYVERGAFNRSGYSMFVGVEPGMQRRGIGQALMEHAEEILRAGSQDVFLLVSDFNHAAQRFYARLGYQQVGAIPDYVIPGVTELVFRKHLAAPHAT
jgi:ribosomal-protein-alanine N-acetyltransferase